MWSVGAPTFLIFPQIFRTFLAPGVGEGPALSPPKGHHSPHLLFYGPEAFPTVSTTSAPSRAAKRAFNFNAGPAALPLPVLERIREELLDYRGTGMSVMELSHRSPEFEAINNAAEQNLRKLLAIPDDYQPGQKLPMLVDYYEKNSQNLHRYQVPRYATAPQFSDYVSNGYLVLTPDIVYTTGHPGQSALKCVLPAIEAGVSPLIIHV